MRPRLLPVLIATVFVAGACGKKSSVSPTVIPPNTPTALQISCPASPTLESLTGAPIAFGFTVPVPTGGTLPVTTTCTPSSGANFGVGSTAVACTAIDAAEQTATCAFVVTVTRPGLLAATKYLAFGDSLTFGDIVTSCPSGTSASLRTPALILRDLRSLYLRAAGPPPATAYPNVLKTLLANRFVNQTVVVTNAGESGEEITELGGTKDATLDRLRAALTVNAPQVLLLQEGINDLNLGSNRLTSIPPIIKALRDMIREGRGRGMQVFLGTLLPQRAGACRDFASTLIAPANEQIRALAASDGAVLVDLYDAFGGTAGPYIGIDGLHPNELGYQKMAQTFFDVIRARLEVPR